MNYDGAHAGQVLSLAFDEQGTTLYSSGADGRVRAWPLKKTLRANEIAKSKVAPIVALASWNGELWGLDGAQARVVASKKRNKAILAKGATRLVATKSRLLAIGDSAAFAIATTTTEKTRRWKLPPGVTTDATADDEQIIIVVKNDTAVHAIDAKGTATTWSRKRNAGSAFVRFDAKGRAWVVARGTYQLNIVNPSTGRVLRKDEYHSLDGAQGGPIAIDPSGRYLVILHNGRSLEVWDLESDACVFAVTIDPDVSDEEVLAGLHRVPIFKPFGSRGGLKRVSSSKPPVIPSAVECMAISNGATRIALGYAGGGILIVDTDTTEIRTTKEILEPARAIKVADLGGVKCATRDQKRIYAVTEQGHLVTFDVANGKCIGDVALEAFAFDNVFDIVPFKNGVRVAGDDVVTWSKDGRRSREREGHL